MSFLKYFFSCIMISYKMVAPNLYHKKLCSNLLQVVQQQQQMRPRRKRTTGACVLLRLHLRNGNNHEKRFEIKNIFAQIDCDPPGRPAARLFCWCAHSPEKGLANGKNHNKTSLGEVPRPYIIVALRHLFLFQCTCRSLPRSFGFPELVHVNPFCESD